MTDKKLTEEEQEKVELEQRDHIKDLERRVHIELPKLKYKWYQLKDKVTIEVYQKELTPE